MDNAKSRTLRREFHEAWYTRASDAGPNAGKWDNTPLIKEISAVCHEEAHWSVSKIMPSISWPPNGNKRAEVMDFQNNILSKVRAAGEGNGRALRICSTERWREKLEEWDVAITLSG